MMNSSINSAVAAGHGKAILVAGFLGLVLSDVIPTPGDALYFWDQQRLRKKLENGDITARQFWIKNAAGYYIYNSAWWAIVFGIVMLSKGSYSHKLKIALGLAGTGVVVGVLARNIKKDERQPEYPAAKKSDKVDLPDGIYNTAEVVGNKVKIMKPDKTIYSFTTSQFMLRNLYINPVKATVIVKGGMATVNI